MANMFFVMSERGRTGLTDPPAICHVWHVWRRNEFHGHGWFSFSWWFTKLTFTGAFALKEEAD